MRTGVSASAAPAHARLRVGVALAVAALTLLVLAGAARANGVPLNNGDVLAGIGNGQVKHFDSSGNLLDTLDTTTGSSETTGMCMDAQHRLYVTDFQANTASTFDSNANLLQANFGSGWNTNPESCVVDSSNHIFFGQADGSTNVLEFDTSGTLLNTFAPAPESRGTDWTDLAADQCTLYYTSEGSGIHRFDVCTNTQLSDFATGLPGPCFALRIRANGDVLVACQTEVVRLDSSGNIVQTYPIPGSAYLFAMNIDPDGTTFWTGDYTNGMVYHVDIATGNVINSFQTNPNTDIAGLFIVGGLTVGAPQLSLSPPSQSQTTGSPASVTATLDVGGAPASGKTILFSVSGANTGSGSGTTNTSGQTTFSYTGTNPGTDTVTACYDANNNGVCDTTESTATATVTWTPGTTGDPAITVTGRTETWPNRCETVATLTDPDTSAMASEYRGYIKWGDGTRSDVSSIVPISGQPGHFRVVGCHVYKAHGTYSASTTVIDVDNTSNTATAPSSLTW